ncbi:MAG: hypothetical protein P8Y97_20990, partial [Candidatus Lokiarchaeota archaeon]
NLKEKRNFIFPILSGNVSSLFPPRKSSPKSFILDNNDLEVLPDNVCQLDKLDKLSIENNNLMELPNCIGKIKDLGELFLGGNKLETLPESIGNIKFLFSLRLNDNSFQEVPEILNKIRFTNLDMRNNPIEKYPKKIGVLNLKLKQNGFYS